MRPIHLSKADAFVWRKFREKFPLALSQIEFDKQLGCFCAPGTCDTPEQDNRWNNLTRRRADVCAHEGGRAWVIELKPNAKPSSLGQVKCYALLLNRDAPPGPLWEPWLITTTLDEDTLYCAKALGVRVTKVDLYASEQDELAALIRPPPARKSTPEEVPRPPHD